MRVRIFILLSLLTLLFSNAFAQPQCYTIDTSRPEWFAASFIRGDANNDGYISDADTAWLIDYLFKEGPLPSCADAGDVDDDGDIDVSDIVYLTNYIYYEGPPPPPPCCFFPEDCGPDTTADTLNCLTHLCMVESTDHGDPNISDAHEGFMDRGAYHFQANEGCATCGKDYSLGVNVVRGNFMLTRTDFFLPGTGFPLEVTFTYNSGSFFNGRYGFGWQLNHNLRYVTNSVNENIIVVKEDDQTDIFVEDSIGSYIPTYSVMDSLSQETVGYKLTSKYGIKYYFDSPDHHYVTRIEDLNVNTLTLTYNINKELTKISDTCGREFILNYAGNKLRNISDWAGNEFSYEYSGDQLVRVINPLDDTTRYEYSDDGCYDLISITDARGNTHHISYNSDFQVDSITTCCGTKTFSYDRDNRTTTVTDANNHSTVYTYDDKYRVVQIQNALGGTTGWEWDEDYHKISETDANGHTTEYQYDSKGNVTQVTDAGGNITQYTYDLRFSKVTSMTDALGRVTNYTYDDQGNLLTQNNPLGHTTTFTYNDKGLMDSQTDANGKVTYYMYDNLDRLWRIVREMASTGDNAVTEYEYDAVGNLTAEIDPNGNRTEYEYTEMNQLKRETNPEGESIFYEYDPVGNLIEETRPNRNVITYEYDERNLLTNISDMIGQVTSYTYDGVGNLLTETDANIHTTTYEYDDLNRLIKTTDPMGEMTDFDYDSVGNLLTFTDRNSNPTFYSYDDVYQRKSMTNVLGHFIEYEYDSVGNLTQITDPNSNVTTYEYDVVNRLIKETYADNTTREFTYDSVGNIRSRKDQPGHTTTYEYNDLYYLTKRDYPDANDDEFTYDKGGRMLTAENAYSSITFAYDRASRVKRSTQNGHTIQYTYYVAIGKRIILYPSDEENTDTYYRQPYPYYSRYTYKPDSSETIPEPDKVITHSPRDTLHDPWHIPMLHRPEPSSPYYKVIIETRDKRNRLVRVGKRGKGTIAQYFYDDANRLLYKSYLNGTVTDYYYNDNDWMDSLKHTKDATLIAGFGHDFDKEGNRKYSKNLLPFNQAKEHTHSEKYSHDAIYRLTNFKTGQLVGADIPSPIKTRSWTLDPVGNWDQFSIDDVNYNNTPNQMNEYDDYSTTNCQPPVPGDDDGTPDDFKDPTATPGADGLNFNHDCNGNLLDDDINAYEYNYENRLIRVIQKSNGDTLGEYRYDPLSRRIQKYTAGITTVYIYDGDRVIEERIGGSIKAKYVYGDWIDEVLTMDRDGEIYFYHTNSLGSIIALTDWYGNVVERYAYDAYGEVSIMDSVGTPLSNSAVGNPYMFTGRRYDPITGLYYYRARYYSAERGRFLQRDPIGIWGDEENLGNGYAYVGNRPLVITDLYGMDSPGCDGVYDGAETPCILECCAEHDKCYRDYECSARSWLASNPLWVVFKNKCSMCNYNVTACITACIALSIGDSEEGAVDDLTKSNYYCASHDVFFDDPTDEHMKHSTDD